MQGQDRDAWGRQREIGAAKAAELRRRTAPYMLRREKAEVLPGGGSSGPAGSGGAGGGGSSTEPGKQQAEGGGNAAGAAKPERPQPKRMGRKTDLVVWLRLAPMQRHIYEAFLNSDAVRAALNSTRRCVCVCGGGVSRSRQGWRLAGRLATCARTHSASHPAHPALAPPTAARSPTRSPLAALSVLKKICDHPALLSQRAASLVVAGAARAEAGSWGRPAHRPPHTSQMRALPPHAAGAKFAKVGQSKDGEEESSEGEGEAEAEAEGGGASSTGSKPDGGDGSSGKPRSKRKGGGEKAGGRGGAARSIDDFIVDDDAEESVGSGSASDAPSSGSADSSDLEEEPPEGRGGARAATKAKAGAGGGGGGGGGRAKAPRGAPAAIGYSEEWCDWAGQGTEIEKRLLADLEGRGAEASCKTAFVSALLDELVGGGHRVLVFSQSRVMLDILQVGGGGAAAGGWSAAAHCFVRNRGLALFPLPA
jgi:SNF2 family DNA or RNA helicase